MDERTFEGGPGLEHAIAANVVERPLHREAADVEFLAVVAVFHDLGRIQVAVSGLDGIPAKTHPGGVRLLVPNLVGPGPGVVGHLDLAAQVGAVDEVPGMVLAGDERDGTAQRQIHPDAHVAVVQKGHPRGRQRGGSPACNRRMKEDSEDGPKGSPTPDGQASLRHQCREHGIIRRKKRFVKLTPDLGR